MCERRHSPSLLSGWWPGPEPSPLLPSYYLSLFIAKPFVTEIRDTIHLWFFVRNWLWREGQQLAHQFLRMVEFNVVSSLAMETVSFILSWQWRHCHTRDRHNSAVFGGSWGWRWQQKAGESNSRGISNRSCAGPPSFLTPRDRESTNTNGHPKANQGLST